MPRRPAGCSPPRSRPPRRGMSSSAPSSGSSACCRGQPAAIKHSSAAERGSDAASMPVCFASRPYFTRGSMPTWSRRWPDPQRLINLILFLFPRGWWRKNIQVHCPQFVFHPPLLDFIGSSI